MKYLRDFLNFVANTSINILEFIVVNDITSYLPNLCITLKILSTWPVTVASEGRSFSKLRLIKKYLSRTISTAQERLDGLATISIERDIAQKLLSLKNLIEKFTVVKEGS